MIFFAFDICKNIIHKDFNGHGYVDFMMLIEHIDFGIREYCGMEFKEQRVL